MSKIIITAGIFPPDIGGPATYGQELANYLAHHGHEVAVICFSDQVNPELQSDYSVIRIKRGSALISHLRYWWALWNVMSGAAVVYAQNPIAGGWQSIMIGGMWNVPVVMKITGDYAWEQAQVQYRYRQNIESFQTDHHLPIKIKVLQLIQRWTVKRAQKILVPSAYLSKLVQKWGAHADDCHIIHNTVNSDFHSERPWSERGPLVISVGRFVPWKQYDQLIDWWSEIRAQIPDARLLIIGDGPDAEVLKSKILPGSAIELVASVPTNQIREYLEQARVFVLNSTYEGLSHVLLEALASGAIPVATDVGGNSEIIQSPSVGILVPLNDKPAMIQALIKALTDATFADLVDRNRLPVLQQFEPEQVWSQTEQQLVSHHES